MYLIALLLTLISEKSNSYTIYKCTALLFIFFHYIFKFQASIRLSFANSGVKPQSENYHDIGIRICDFLLSYSIGGSPSPNVERRLLRYLICKVYYLNFESKYNSFNFVVVFSSRALQRIRQIY